MTTGEPGNARSAALDEYIARWAKQGFRVESKSSLQAVLVRRHRPGRTARTQTYTEGQLRRAS